MLARSSKRRRRRQNSNMLDPNAWKQDCALLLETMLESDDSIPFRHAVDINEFPVSTLRSMDRELLFVPFACTSTSQTCAVSVVGPSVWNGLPLAQQLLPRVLSDTFYCSLKLVFLDSRGSVAAE